MSDRSEKAYRGKAATSSQLSATQERFARNTTNGSSEGAPALDLSNWTGSWAASHSFGEGSVLLRNGTTALDGGEGVHYSHLGQPGRPEINFRPYDFNSNRMGSRGPSLMGHPVSFSVVGPTAKSRVNDVQWEIVDNSASPGVGDTLTIYDHGALSIVTGINTPPIATTLLGLFGRTTLSEFAGGLYLVITQTGYEPDVVVSSNPGGLSDGGLWNPDTLDVLTPKNAESKYEIFRVTGYNSAGGVLTLDPTKRLGDYFTVGSPSLARGIMLLEPAAAQMAAIPGSGASRGAEQVFAFLPPTRSLNDDTQPPYSGGTTGDGTWTQGGLELYNPSSVEGEGAYYALGVNLPVPTPRFSGTVSDNPLADPSLPVLRKGRLPTTAEITPVPTDLTGHWRIVVEDSDASDLGRIVCIRKVHKTFTTSPDDVVLKTIGGTSYPEDTVLGFYEVIGVFTSGLDFYALRRLSDFDPQTGVMRYNSPDRFEIPVGTNALELEFTVHDTIVSLHLSPTYPYQGVQAARLTHLIDPDRVGQTGLKGNGGGADRARHAAFSTVPGTNPGSLADLGFGAVFYPAKLVGGLAVPDFERPIYPGAVTLDSSVNEAQSLEVDYASGLVYLSHPPVTGSDISPNGIISGANNPRGQIVLFASFVAYSQEASQRGSGMLVRGGRPDSEVSAGPLCRKEAYPIFVSAVPNTGFSDMIRLNTLPGEDHFPEAGFGEIIEGTDPDDPNLVPSTFLVSGTVISSFLITKRRVATVGYTAKGTWLDGSTERVALLGVYGGTAAGYGPSYITTYIGELSFVPRFDVVAPTNIEGVAGVAYSQDTNYGSALRAKSLKIKDGDVRLGAEGAVVTFPRLDAHEEIFGSVLSNTVVRGGALSNQFTTGLVFEADFSEGTALIDGVLVPFDTVRMAFSAPPNDTTYIYVVGSREGGTVQFGTSIPTGGVVLYQFVTDGVAIISDADLRNLHSNLDKRVEVTVGLPSSVPLGGVRTTQPHFFYLKDAVAYVTHVHDVGVPGASSGSTYKIRVISDTEIEEPITIPIDGLIIEGTAGVNIDVTLASGELAFDFNSTSGFQIRDLNFTLSKTGSGERYLFGGVGSDVVIENITFDGNDEGSFLRLNSASTRVLINRCRAFDLDHFGANISGNLITNVKIQDCNFSRSSAPDSAGDGQGIRFTSPFASSSALLSVDNSTLVGWTTGVYCVDSVASVWTDCYINNSGENGVFVGTTTTPTGASAPNHTFDKVRVNNANTSTGGFFGFSVNIPGVHILNSSVTNTNTSGVDVSFDSSAHDCLIRDSFCSGIQANTDRLKILNNKVTNSITFSGDDTILSGNYLETGDIIGSGSAARPVVTGNNVEGGTLSKFGIIMTSATGIVSNNTIRNGSISVGSGSVVTGNRTFFVTQGGDISAGDGSSVTGNLCDTGITVGADSTATGNKCGDNLSLASNSIVQANNVTGDIVLEESSTKFIIMANRVTNIRTALSSLNPDPTAIVLGNVVTGNSIFGVVAVGGTTVDNNTM